jgi:hypothetical protein
MTTSAVPGKLFPQAVVAGPSVNPFLFAPVQAGRTNMCLTWHIRRRGRVLVIGGKKNEKGCFSAVATSRPHGSDAGYDVAFYADRTPRELYARLTAGKSLGVFDPVYFEVSATCKYLEGGLVAFLNKLPEPAGAPLYTPPPWQGGQD